MPKYVITRCNDGQAGKVNANPNRGQNPLSDFGPYFYTEKCFLLRASLKLALAAAGNYNISRSYPVGDAWS